MQAVLDQIQSALKKEHANSVKRVGNRISFSAGSFYKRWMGRGPLQMIGSGEIEAAPSGDCLMVDYRLSLFEPLAITAIEILVLVFSWHRGVAARHNVLPLVLIALALLVRNTVVAVHRFSAFLRQFPRED
jgi:hypothetical protein